MHPSMHPFIHPCTHLPIHLSIYLGLRLRLREVDLALAGAFDHAFDSIKSDMFTTEVTSSMHCANGLCVCVEGYLWCAWSCS